MRVGDVHRLSSGFLLHLTVRIAEINFDDTIGRTKWMQTTARMASVMSSTFPARRGLTPCSMPFPFSSSGTIEVTSHETAGLHPIVSAIESDIRDSKPTSLSVNDGTLSFRAGVFRWVNSWNQLVSIGSGEISL